MAKHQHERAATMSVTLPTDMARAVFDRIRAGVYGSAGELIREAVRRLLETEAAEAAAKGDAEGEGEEGKRAGRRSKKREG